MAKLKNDRLIRAILRQPVDRTPIWVMRQAGRYLPEYREVRGQAGSFMNLCQNPELACEVTLQPLRRYNMDAAIIFSDILTIPDAMGLGLGFAPGEGPFFEKPARTAKDINALEVPDLAKLEYVYDAIKLTTKGLDNEIPLIGFCGSPWTLACYVIEGRGKNGFPLIQKMLKEDPKLLHTLLDVLAQSVVAHLNAQIKAPNIKENITAKNQTINCTTEPLRKTVTGRKRKSGLPRALTTGHECTGPSGRLDKCKRTDP